MSASRSSSFNFARENSPSTNEVETLNDFQNICKFCFNFNQFCKCGGYVGDRRLENANSSFDFTKCSEPPSLEVPVLIYSPPVENEQVRTGVDYEEIGLKSRYKHTIPPGESRAIVTNLRIHRKQNEIPRKLEVLNKIRSEWLNETFNAMFICKSGVISPRFSGDLILKIYNKSSTEITIEEGSPIGTLTSSRYEYQ